MNTIEVRLFATLRNDRNMKEHVEFREGICGRDIITLLEIDEEEIAIFLINGISGSIDAALENTDYLSIFPPIGGG
jgi:molybdopterin converting factor small subunit